jgi:hypothetical protein
MKVGQAALSYAARGWRVVPIPRGTKHPPMDEWQRWATTDVELIRQWWTAHPTHGVGIATGVESGIFVLDVDVADGKRGDDTLADLEATYSPLPATMEVITGSGGRHLYFGMPEGVVIVNSAGGRLGPGLDIRGEGGQVLAPPTLHPNGKRYEWEASSLDEVADAPGWLVALLTSAPAGEARRERRTAVDDDTPGNRYAAAHTWPELLEGDGAVFLGTRRYHLDGSNYEVWARPGLPSNDLHVSGTLYFRGSDVLKVHSSEWPHLMIDETYTKFGYYAATRHGGDMRAAARELGREERSMAPALSVVSSTNGELVVPDEVILSTWEPVDLTHVMSDDYEPLVPTILRRADEQAMFYAGRTNALVGESGSGKSWVALISCAAMIQVGGTVLYVDLEDHPRSITDRLRAIGLAGGDIVDRFVYVRPELGALRLVSDAREIVDVLIQTHGVDLVVIDSVGEAMALEGMKQNDDDEVARWYRFIAKRWAALGPAVILVDHVPKNTEGSKLFAIGSQRKKASTDGAMFMVEQVKPLGKGRDGRLLLTTAKDRNGTYPIGLTAAEIEVKSSDDGKKVDVKINPPAERDPETGQVKRPTFLMERVSRWLELNSESSQTTIEKEVQGKAAALRASIRVLADEGWIVSSEGPKGPLWRVARAFREIDEIMPEPVDNSGNGSTPSSPSPPRPVPSRDGVTPSNSTPSTPSPLVSKRGTGDGVAEGQGTGRGEPVDNLQLEIESPF